MTATTRSQPFRIGVSDEALSDLVARLRKTRMPVVPATPGRDSGVDLASLGRFLEYWRDEFDWRNVESRLNTEPHHRATVRGLPIHFIHHPSPEPDAIPMVLMHGWPSSFFEFHRVGPALADPLSTGGSADDAFHVVIVSLPGFVFSSPLPAAGTDVQAMADTVHSLMTEVLGYKTYVAHGGDWGGLVASRLGFDHPDRVMGLHLTMPGATAHPDRRRDLSAEELEWMRNLRAWQVDEMGYSAIQSSKPHTLGVGLSDSPAGLAAWLFEKYQGWSDGDAFETFGLEDIATAVSLYWFTESVTSSCRIYLEHARRPWHLAPDEGIDVPTSFAVFPKEIVRPPRAYAARAYRDIRRWTEMPHGGHFPAWEQPTTIIRDLRDSFRFLRTAKPHLTTPGEEQLC